MNRGIICVVPRWWCVGIIALLAGCHVDTDGSTQPPADRQYSPLVVALGDSITKGARPARGDAPQVREEDTFCSLLQERLPEAYPTARVINAGVSSNRTDHAVDRLAADVLSRNPDAVLIMFGTNDACWDKDATGPRLPLEDYETNLRRICERVQNQGGTPILMTPIPLGEGFGLARHRVYIKQGPNGPMEPYVRACRTVAADLSIPLIDHFEAWQAEAAGTTTQRTTDLCHPNARGHRVLADTIEPVLRRAIDARAGSEP